MAFKQKGSPFQRNFGIGKSPLEAASPAKDTKVSGGMDQESDETHKKTVPHNEKGEHEWKSPAEMKSPMKEKNDRFAEDTRTDAEKAAEKKAFEKGKSKFEIEYLSDPDAFEKKYPDGPPDPKWQKIQKEKEERKKGLLTMKSPAKQVKSSPAKGKVHTHPHPEEKKKESKGTKTDYPLNQFGNIDWSKVPRGEGQGTMKVEKAPTEMKSPVKHLIGKHPAKDGHVRADHKKNRETKKETRKARKEASKQTNVDAYVYHQNKEKEKRDPNSDYNTRKNDKGETRAEYIARRKKELGVPTKMKSPVKDKDKIAKAKSRVQDAKETVTAYKEPGETRKLGTSIWQDTDMGTGETRATKKSERKLKRAEKKISKAEKLYAKGKTKRAERKLKRATKKADKAISIMTKHGSGRTKRTVQDKYKDDPRYKGEQAEYDSQFR